MNEPRKTPVFTPHRGGAGLDECEKDAVDIEDMAALRAHLDIIRPSFTGEVALRPYAAGSGYAEYIVTIGGCAVGYIDSPLDYYAIPFKSKRQQS